jgi:hypothetical protein
MRRRLLVCTALSAIATGVPVGVAVAHEAAPATAIKGVTFERLKDAGVVIVRGSGFGSPPAPNPSYRPTPPRGNAPPYGCSATGKVGWDYGTQLWISFKRPGAPLWSAGRYRPALQELDCVGIIILEYTPQRVTFRLGSGYRFFHFQIKPGDRFTVSVRGAVKRGSVP